MGKVWVGRELGRRQRVPWCKGGQEHPGLCHQEMKEGRKEGISLEVQHPLVSVLVPAISPVLKFL